MMTNSNKITAFGPDLMTPKDLLQKLEYDYIRVQSNPRDSYAAFDFFVTAEHMVDWIANKPLRTTEPLLKIVSHLANGAKHFALNSDRHKSVSGLGVNGEAFQANAFDSSAFQVGHLIVSLEGNEAKLFGANISVSDLAKSVIEYWRKNFGLSASTT